MVHLSKAVGILYYFKDTDSLQIPLKALEGSEYWKAANRESYHQHSWWQPAGSSVEEYDSLATIMKNWLLCRDDKSCCVPLSFGHEIPPACSALQPFQSTSFQPGGDGDSSCGFDVGGVMVRTPEDEIYESWAQLVNFTWSLKKGIPGGRRKYLDFRDLRIGPRFWPATLHIQDGFQSIVKLVASTRGKPRMLPGETVDAEVRIFFNAGWRLQFDVVLDMTAWPAGDTSPAAGGTSPVVAIKLGGCRGPAEHLSFRVMHPREKVVQLDDDKYVATLRFGEWANHLKEDDQYADWRRAYGLYKQSVPRLDSSNNGGHDPIAQQLLLHLCYYDDVSDREGESIGLVHFVLAPSDGFEFVIFSVVGLIGIPVLLMAGFRCLAQKHAGLRQDIVGCIASDAMFAKQFDEYLLLSNFPATQTARLTTAAPLAN